MPPVEGEPPRPANVKVLIEAEHVMDTLDTLQVIKTIRTIAVDCMKNGTILPPQVLQLCDFGPLNLKCAILTLQPKMELNIIIIIC